MDVSVKTRWILLSVILILFLSFEDSRAGGIPSFCDIPPVKEGGNATLTCTFTEDISETKSDFEIDQIDRYSPTHFKQETLLVCTWNIDEPICYMNPRITFDPVITNTLQIQILNVKSTDAGKYICYILPTSNGISKSCNLTLEETEFISETYAPRNQLPRVSAVPMMDTSTKIEDSKEDGQLSQTIVIIIAVLIMFLILQVIICFVVVKYLKRHSGGGSNGNDTNPSKNINNNPTTGDDNANQELLDKSINNEGSIRMSSIHKSSSDDDFPPAPVLGVGLSDRESYILLLDQYIYKGESMGSLTMNTSDDTLSTDSESVLRDDPYENADKIVSTSSLITSVSGYDHPPSPDLGIELIDEQYEDDDKIVGTSSLNTRFSDNDHPISPDLGNLPIDEQYDNGDEIVVTLSLITGLSDNNHPVFPDLRNIPIDDQYENADKIVGTSSLNTSFSDYDDFHNLLKKLQSEDQYENADKIVGTSSLNTSFSDYDDFHNLLKKLQSETETCIRPLDQYEHKGESMSSLTMSTSEDNLSIDSKLVLREQFVRLLDS